MLLNSQSVGPGVFYWDLSVSATSLNLSQKTFGQILNIEMNNLYNSISFLVLLTLLNLECWPYIKYRI